MMIYIESRNFMRLKMNFYGWSETHLPQKHTLTLKLCSKTSFYFYHRNMKKNTDQFEKTLN